MNRQNSNQTQYEIVLEYDRKKAEKILFSCGYFLIYITLTIFAIVIQSISKINASFIIYSSLLIKILFSFYFFYRIWKLKKIQEKFLINEFIILILSLK